MKSIHQACLVLGSNIEPEVNIPRTVRQLKECLLLTKLSSVWHSESVECCYPDYLNLAVVVSTPLDARELKEQILLPLEARLGRVRTEDKNASRTIDIDIILFDNEVHDPELYQQAYLAVPVAELFPDLRSPDHERLIDIAKRLSASTPIDKRTDISIPRS